jgi:deazaflavin-dependent oxidoreductase (nitroreductase family)
MEIAIVLNPLMRGMVAFHVALYRLSGGRILGRIGKARICLLTTRGRKSGKTRTVPLNCLQEGDEVVVVASLGGAPRHPTWFLNLEADPHAEVELGAMRRDMRARVASAEEKSRLWPKLLEIYPAYETYQKRTERQIPVVVLAPD